MMDSAHTLRRRIRPLTAFRVAAVIFFWAVMTVWLIRFEACPERFTGRFDGYRDLFKGGVLIRSAWMRILADGSPIGYSHTEIDVNDKEPGAHYRIDSEMELDLNIMNLRQKVYSRLVLTLDILSRLQRFTFSLRSQGADTEIEGRRLHGDRFTIAIQSGGGSRSLDLSIPDDVVLYSPMLEQALGALKPGQRRTFRTLDPASLAVADVLVRADRQEPLTLTGRTVATTVLATEYQGMTIWTWVDRDGTILRQETPLGWVIEACSSEEAMAFKSVAAKRRELLAAAAVPADRPIPNPRQVRRLDVFLKGVEAPIGELTTDRQEAVDAGTNGVRVIVRADGWPAPSEPVKPSRFTNELAASPFIQSDDPAILAKARAIAGGDADAAAAARAINDWVFNKVRKTPSAGLPSALAVLETMEGDCNEHTYLTVALCRAAGIPAKVMAGLVYMNGAFYYHAWPAVRAGNRWVEMDPTFGQEIADATHIALAEGELAGQTRLLRYIGRLTIGVLSFEKELAP